MTMTRILVADDHSVVRNGVREMLATCSDMVIVAEASTAAEIVELTSRSDFDVILLDLTLPDGRGLDLLQTLRENGCLARVVVFTFRDDCVSEALQAGAVAYVTKDADAPELQAAIRSAVAGRRFISERVQRHATPRTVGTLSNRENEVFSRIIRGRRPKEIALELQISDKTVSTHRARMLRKLGLAGNHDLLMYAIREGLVSQ